MKHKIKYDDNWKQCRTVSDQLWNIAMYIHSSAGPGEQLETGAANTD